MNDAGQYLVNWDVGVISATSGQSLVSLGIFDVTGGTFLTSVNSGTGLSSSQGAELSGTLLFTATAGQEIQLRNGSVDSITTIATNGYAAGISITRIN